MLDFAILPTQYKDLHYNNFHLISLLYGSGFVAESAESL